MAAYVVATPSACGLRSGCAGLLRGGDAMGRHRSLTRHALASLAAMVAAVFSTLSPAYANSYRAAIPVDISVGGDPLGTCTADNVAQQEATFGSTHFPSAESEPRVAIGPTNPHN